MEQDKGGIQACFKDVALLHPPKPKCEGRKNDMLLSWSRAAMGAGGRQPWSRNPKGVFGTLTGLYICVLLIQKEVEMVLYPEGVGGFHCPHE